MEVNLAPWSGSYEWQTGATVTNTVRARVVCEPISAPKALYGARPVSEIRLQITTQNGNMCLAAALPVQAVHHDRVASELGRCWSSRCSATITCIPRLALWWADSWGYCHFIYPWCTTTTSTRHTRKFSYTNSELMSSR